MPILLHFTASCMRFAAARYGWGAVLYLIWLENARAAASQAPIEMHGSAEILKFPASRIVRRGVA